MGNTDKAKHLLLWTSKHFRFYCGMCRC
jgi:hypothetical protein